VDANSSREIAREMSLTHEESSCVSSSTNVPYPSLPPAMRVSHRLTSGFGRDGCVFPHPLEIALSRRSSFHVHVDDALPASLRGETPFGGDEGLISVAAADVYRDRMIQRQMQADALLARSLDEHPSPRESSLSPSPT
jgi:hypothetical protein